MERIPISYDKASLFSDYLMIWCVGFVRTLRSQELSLERLPEIPKKFKYYEDYEILKENWLKELKRPRPKFLRALFQTGKRDYIVSSIWLSFFHVFSLSQIFFVGLIIDYIEDEDAGTLEGVIYTACFVISFFLSVMSIMRAFFTVILQIGRIKNWITSLVSEKILDIDSEVLNSENITGKITNIIGTDVELFDLALMTVHIWASPAYLVGSITLLYLYLGFPGLISVLITILYILGTLFLGKLITKIRLRLGKFSDSRVKMISNLIEGIKIVKLYAWEEPFLNLIYKERSKEIREYFKTDLIQTSLKSISYALSGISIFVTLAVIVASGSSFSLSEALSGMMVIFYMNNITLLLVTGIRVFFLSIASCNRITEVLLLKEKSIRLSNSKSEMIELKDAIFTWGSETVLRHISFNAGAGDLILVVGPVGSGKTSLILGLLQEISLASGSSHIGESVSYCPENSWIISSSIKENIVMGQEFKQEVYDFAIEASCLTSDLALMEDGDETLVGDRGVTLSGGQKARISLARAFYADKDILLLDDPLSAVDAEVGRHLIENIFALTERGKCVILATHQLHAMNYSTKVLILDNTRQVFFGHYTEIGQEVESVIGQIKPTQVHEEFKKISKPKELQRGSTMKLLEQEERSKGSIPLKTYWKFFTLGYKNAVVIFIVGLLLLISQAVSIGIFFWISIWADADDQSDSIYYNGFLLILLGLFIFGTIRFGAILFGLTISNKNLHNQAIKGITLTDSSYFDKNPTGRILNRFTKDTITMDEPLLHYYSEGFHLILLVFGNLIVVMIISPASLSALVILAIIIYLVVKKILPVSSELRKIELASRSPLLTSATAIMSGLVTIRTLGLNEKFVREAQNASANNARAYMCYNLMLRYIQFVIEYGSFSVIALNAIIVVALKGSINPELAAISLGLTTGICGFMNYSIKTFIEIENFMASPQRLFEYKNLLPEGVFTNSSELKIKKGKIEFDNLCVKYQPHLPLILDSLTFSIQEGSTVGIVGRTGAGKSTIMQALLRLIEPWKGTIYIDGQDYKQAGLHDLRRQISVIPQTPFLFRASIRENLDPFEEHSDNKIYEVLKSVKLFEIVEQLSERLNTQIMSRELNLSAGQKQLVCLARAILRNNKIIMMDEATANVDHLTDQFIQNEVMNLFSESTILIIAHRIRTIIKSDLIVVIDQGRCSEIGSPKELAYSDSLFRNLIDHTSNEEKQYLLEQLS